MVLAVDKAQKEEKQKLQLAIEEMIFTGKEEIVFSLDSYKENSYYDVIYSAIRNARLPWERYSRVSHFKFGKSNDGFYIRRIK